MLMRRPAGWFPKRGEVYWISLDKKRPAVILSVDALNKHALDVSVVPLTTVPRAKFSLRVPVYPREGGLRTKSWAKCDQVTTLDQNHLVRPALGMLTRTTMQAIEDGVRFALGLIPLQGG